MAEQVLFYVHSMHLILWLHAILLNYLQNIMSRKNCMGINKRDLHARIKLSLTAPSWPYTWFSHAFLMNLWVFWYCQSQNKILSAAKTPALESWNFGNVLFRSSSVRTQCYAIHCSNCYCSIFIKLFTEIHISNRFCVYKGDEKY